MNKMVYFEKSTGLLHLRDRSAIRWLMLFVSMWTFLVKPFGSLPGVASYAKYIADVVLVLMLFLLFSRRNLSFRRTAVPALILACIFFAYTLVVYVFRFQSPFYFLWGLRNNFRFYVAFFAFIAFMDETDVADWFKIADVLFWLNIVASIVQFVLLGIKQDDLGGIFGVDGGFNGYTLLLFSIVVGKSLLAAMAGQEKVSVCAWKCIASLVVAAMAELKFYFLLFLLLLGMASVFSGLSWRKLLILTVGVLAVMAGSTLLVIWFDIKGVWDIQRLITLATKKTYSTGKDLNRLSAVPILANTILSQPVDQMFGLGLGNCDTSAFAICNTPFYQRYSYLHYTWFSAAMLFLETGYVGLVLYGMFFVLVFQHAFRRRKVGGNVIYCQLAMMMVVVSGILLFYNSSLRTEAAYMIYFVFAAPFICGTGRVPPKSGHKQRLRA